MIRVVRVVTRLNVGGPTHHVTMLSGRLDRKRFQTLLVTGRPSPEEGNLTAEARRNAHVVVLPELSRQIHPWRDAVTWLRLMIVLLRFKPHIVHTHMAKAGALGRSAAWVFNGLQRLRNRPRCRVLHTFHGHVWDGYFHPTVAWWFLVCERWLGKRTDRLIAINRSMERNLRERRIGRPERIIVIPLGLALDSLQSLNGRCASTDTGKRTWRIGIVGRLVPIKNHDLLFRGLYQLRVSSPELSWTVDIVGDGALRFSLEETVRRLGLSDRVRFLGWQTRVTGVYGNLDLVCLTSNNEGSPVALIESLAAAKPVLGTDVGGVGELLGGHCQSHEPFVVAPHGIVARPRDPDAIAAALRWAMTHPEEHAKTATAGRQYVCATFNAERLLHDISQLYQQLMSSEEETCTR